MRAAVAKWGNSLALRIPTAFAREIAVRDGAPVDISVADGALVVRLLEPACDLDGLIARITDDNRHGEITTGRPVGNET